MTETNITTKTVRLFTKKGFRYQGQITSEDTHFFYIFDTKEQRTFLISKTEIETIEVIE